MTFEEYWKQVEETGILPRVAVLLLPDSFSDELKEELMTKEPEDVAKTCQRVINAINAGSVETIETLLKKRI